MLGTLAGPVFIARDMTVAKRKLSGRWRRDKKIHDRDANGACGEINIRRVAGITASKRDRRCVETGGRCDKSGVCRASRNANKPKFSVRRISATAIDIRGWINPESARTSDDRRNPAGNTKDDRADWNLDG